MLLTFISGVVLGGTSALFISYYHFTNKILKPYKEMSEELTDQVKKKDVIIEKQNQMIDELKRYVPGQN